MFGNTNLIALAGFVSMAAAVAMPGHLDGHVMRRGNGTVVTTTKVVSQFTTYCPEPTTFHFGTHTYTVTAPTTLTITDCPCTIVEPCPTCPPVPIGTPGPKPSGTKPGFIPSGSNSGNIPSGTNPAVPGETATEGVPPAVTTGPSSTATGVPPVSGAAESGHQFGVVALAGAAVMGLFL